MKHTLRILALITALFLTLPMLGCLVPNQDAQKENASETGEVKTPEDFQPGDSEGGAANESENGGDRTEPDEDAIAVELGDIQIKVSEFENMYDQYVSMFAGYGFDEEMLNEVLGMAEDSLIEYYTPEWMAKKLGVSLSAEEEAEIEAEVERLLGEERDEIILDFAEDIEADEPISDVSLLSEEQIAAALEEINSQLAMYFGDGYTFDDYLAMRRDSYLTSMRVDKYTAILEEDFRSDAVSDAETVNAKYDEMLSAQKEQFDADPSLFLKAMNGEKVADELSFPLYVPVSAARLEVVRVQENTEPDPEIIEAAEKMAELEAEYGALALNDKNTVRRAEIEIEYAALKEKVETAETANAKAAQNRIDAAYADLKGGMTFEDAMNAYNEPDAEGSRGLSFVVLTGAEEPDFPELAAAAASLAPGAYSAPIRVDDEYFIVKLVETFRAGERDRASIEEDFRASLRNSADVDAAWDERLNAWIEEAKAAAVFHREAYETLPELYLSYYGDY